MKLGRAYLGVENLTFNQLRTVLCSIAIVESIKLGMTMDNPVIADFAASILTSVKVRGVYRILSESSLFATRQCDGYVFKQLLHRRNISRGC